MYVIALYKQCQLPVAYFATCREILPKNGDKAEKAVIKEKEDRDGFKIA